MIKTSVSPKELKDIVRSFARLQSPPTLFVWGQPGIGKTEIVRQVAKEQHLDLKVLILSLMDPAEIKGFLMPDKRTSEAILFPYNFLPKEPGILFLDEVNTAPPAVLNVGMRMVQEREVGSIKIPPGVLVICAGNRVTDKVTVSKLSSAFVNKCVHVNVEPSFEDFKEWALTNGISPIVLGYLEAYPGDLVSEPRVDYPYPTPRAWEKVHRVLTETSLPIQMQQALIAGLVGDEIAVKFIEFSRNAFDIQNWLKDILDEGKNRYPTAEEPAKSYLLTSSLAQKGCLNVNLLARIMEYLAAAPSYFSPFAISVVKSLLHVVGESTFFKYGGTFVTPFVEKYADVFKSF